MRQYQAAGFIQKRLDYIFVSSMVQDSDTQMEIFARLLSNHSPFFFFLETRMAEAAGKWFMEFDNSLIVNNNFVTRIKIPSADTWLKL